MLPCARSRSLGVEPVMTRRPGAAAEGAARGGAKQKAEEQPKAAMHTVDPTHKLLRGRSHRRTWLLLHMAACVGVACHTQQCLCAEWVLAGGLFVHVLDMY